MRIDLSGKVALVTGGSRGIGAAICGVLGDCGAEVLVHYTRHRQAACEVAARIGAERSRVLCADLNHPSAARMLWQEAEAWRGRVDIVVNNAAIANSAPFDADDSLWSRVWDETFRVNVAAVAHCCRDAVSHFRTRGGGILINIASRAAFRGDTPDYAAYAASKGAVVALTRTIARGFASEGIIAYTVAPGFVETDMAADFYRRVGKAAIVSEIPMGDVVAPVEVANTVAFLASGLARHATGATIDINGASYIR